MSRRLLLGSTLLSTALLLAPSAQAEMRVVAEGFTTFQAGFFENDTVTNPSGRDFRSEAEVHIKADGKTGNGLFYGARIELLASTSDTSGADEASIFIRGNWGRIELGDNDGAADIFSMLAPTVGIGQINGSYANYIPTASRPAGNSKDTGGGMFKALDSDDSTKVTYTSPRIEGFQAGISYVPENDDQASGELVQFSDASGNQRDMIETGFNYTRKISDVNLRLGGAYTMADAKDGSGREDIASWNLGAQVTYADVTFGGGYVDNGDSNNNAGVANDDETAWNVGARYRKGDWGVALNYLAEDYEDNGGRGVTTGGGTFQSIVLGGTYKIADGLTTSADLAFFDRNRDTGVDDDGYVLVLETRARF